MGLLKFAAIELKQEIESTGLIGQITFDFSASLIVSSNVVGGLSIKSSLKALTGAAASIARAY